MEDQMRTNAIQSLSVLNGGEANDLNAAMISDQERQTIDSSIEQQMA